MWNATKATIQGKLIALSAYIKKNLNSLTKPSTSRTQKKSKVNQKEENNREQISTKQKIDRQ